MSHPDIDDAVERLVVAIKGVNDPVASSLARRVLMSQIGSSPEDEILDVSSTWRRIGRKSADVRCREDMESFYSRLECQCPPHLPPKILTVLAKLMGKHMKLPQTVESTSSSGSRNRNATPMSRSTMHEASRPTVNASSSYGLNSTSRNINPLNTALRPKHQPLGTISQDRHSIERQIGDEKRELEKEEALLLRECLYSLQGIDGERIRYYHKENYQESSIPNVDDAITYYDGVRVKSPALSNVLLYTGRVMETRLGTGAADALRISGEAGWLYHRVQSFIHNVQEDKSKGFVARAFAGTLGDELKEYHSLLTQYESQLDKLTLRQLMVDLRLPTSRLQTLSLLADGLSHLSGGHLLTGLYQHTFHGDSRHAKLTQSILCAASKPWFDILHTWTTQGVLSDPHGEFFVKEIETVDDKYLWNEKYKINKDQIPDGIIPRELVGPALNVGKGINFIRRCLLDSQWSMNQNGQLDDDDDTVTTSGGGIEQLGFLYTPCADSNPGLEKTLGRAATLVHTHILKTLKEENRLMQHLFALKQFLLLGQGDFFSALMEGLHSEFRGKNLVGIYKHSLLSIVETGLRSTNAKYLPQDILDRLQVELLIDPDDITQGMFGQNVDQKGIDSRTVWDIFMLDYQMPDPLKAIANSQRMNQYKQVFSLLFGLKRIEFMLNFTWRQSAILQHSLQTYGQYNGIKIQNSPSYALAFSLLRKISILRQNMMHMVVNLKSYFMFEVVEGGWQRLQEDIEDAKSLDELIVAHDAYINGMVKKSLLRGGDTDDEIQMELADFVQRLLQTIGEFCTLQESFFHESLSLAENASQKRVEAERRLHQGHWGFETEVEIAEEEDFFGLSDEEKIEQVDIISSTYNETCLDLLRLLSERVNANPDDLGPFAEEDDMLTEFGIRRHRKQFAASEDDLDSQRFLIAQLDHNNFYGEQGYSSQDRIGNRYGKNEN